MKLTREASKLVIGRAARLALKRLGVPFWAWPLLWLGHRTVRHYLRKRGGSRGEPGNVGTG